MKELYDGLAIASSRRLPPQYALNKKHIASAFIDIPQGIEAQDQDSCPFYLAWRASGKLVPAFESEDDLGHKCRRGTDEEIRCIQGRILSIVSKMGGLLQHRADNATNLDREELQIHHRANTANRHFNSCNHSPICGTTSELEAFARSTWLAPTPSLKRCEVV